MQPDHGQRRGAAEMGGSDHPELFPSVDADKKQAEPSSPSLNEPGGRPRDNASKGKGSQLFNSVP